MTKVKVSEASGVVLDYMVAVALGGTEFWFDTVNTCWIKIDGEDRALSTKWSNQQNFAPTALWAHGGPIIEREKISIIFNISNGVAARTTAYPPEYHYGPTILIAAMRCYVTSKLGEEVEVPDELVRVS